MVKKVLLYKVGMVLLLLSVNAMAEEHRLIEEILMPEGISSPGEVRVDSNGNVWFTEKVGKSIVLYEPEKNSFTAFKIPNSWGNVGPEKFTIAEDGSIWFSVRRWAEDVEPTDFIGRLIPMEQRFERYELKGGHVPEEMVVDKGGVVWFIDVNHNELCSFEPEAKRLEAFTIPTANSYPRGLVIDREGNLWFAEANGNKIARFLVKERRFEEFTIPTPMFNPVAVSIDGDGRVWFAGLSANKIGLFYPERAIFNELIIPTPRGLPNSIGIDRHGNVWFVEYMGNRVGRFNPTTAQIEEFDIPTFNSLPGSVALDNRRDILWFAETSTEAKRLGKVDIKRIDSAMAQAEGSQPDVEGSSGVDKSGEDRKGWGTILLGVLFTAIALYLVMRTRKKA